MNEQVPSVGRIVHYRLSALDVETIRRHRAMPSTEFGATAHRGNAVSEGDIFPMLIVRVWGTSPESAVNGHVFLDGNDTLWVTSCTVGFTGQSGTFGWPNGVWYPPSSTRE